MTEEVTIDVRMTPSEDDGDGDVQGNLNVRVADEEGSSMPDRATITVTGLENDYRKSKPGGDHGISQTFDNVPMPANVSISASGYETITVEVTEADLGGGDITRGYN